MKTIEKQTNLQMKMKRLVLLIPCIGLTAALSGQTVMGIDEFRARALEQNKTLMASEANVKAATELRKAAFTQFLPNITANGAYMWNERNISLLAADALLPVGTKMADGSFGFTSDQITNKWMQVAEGVYAPLDANGVPFDPAANPEKIQWKDYAYLPKESMEFDIHNIWVGQVGFVQPVFMGFKVRELYRIARANEDMATVQADNSQQELMINVDEDYWRVVSVMNKKLLAEKYVDLLGKLESNVATMVDEGVATKGDLLNVRVKLNEAKMSLTRAENGYRLSKMALLQLCGMPLDSDAVPADLDLDQVAIEPMTVDDIESAIESRAEIRQLKLVSDMAQSNVNIMASRLMPNIAITGNWMVSNPNVYNGFSRKLAGGFNAGIVMSIPICHWGDQIHTLRAAKYQRQIAEYKTDEARELIRLQISQQNYKIDEANRKLTAAQDNIVSADENLRFAQAAFDEGVAGVTDLLGAQAAWLSANSEKIDAGIDVMLCDLYLRRAQGIKIE